MMIRFSLNHWWAIVTKEFVQMRRDRLTFAMIIGIQLMQPILFGFAINSDPKHLPTAILMADQSIFSRTILQALTNSGYFQIVKVVDNEAKISHLLALGEVQFALTIPTDFARQLVRGERPVLLVVIILGLLRYRETVD